MRAAIVSLCLGGVTAYTSANNPYAAGNSNFPQETGGFNAEIEKSLPVINVKYQFNQAAQDPLRMLRDMESRLAIRRRARDAAAARSFLKGEVEDALSSAQDAVKVMPVAIDSQKTSDMNEMMQGMSRVPRPMKRSSVLINPNVEIGLRSCPRDYSAACPEGFVMQGQFCVAAGYTGPCASESHDFSSWSMASKQHWSEQCSAFWPCESCTRAFHEPCPAGFELGDDGACTPGSAYTGSCKATNFSEFNAAMRASWSDRCGAHWSCA